MATTRLTIHYLPNGTHQLVGTSGGGGGGGGGGCVCVFVCLCVCICVEGVGANATIRTKFSKLDPIYC